MSDLKAEIGHVLFVDIVGYSKLLINEQTELLEHLNGMVRSSEQIRSAEAEGRLIRLATGDGMALVFRNNPEAPVKCALELSRADKEHPELQLRMGIHSGAINEVIDINERANVTGAGINLAQRVMDCGDAGHILLSKRVADDLAQYRHWQPYLHELGECVVKHGVRLELVNLYTDELGNPERPAKFNAVAAQTLPRSGRAFTLSKIGVYVLVLSLIGLVIPAVIFAPAIFRARQSATSSPTASAGPAKSIAVLPFENLSDDKANAYFANGMQDMILTKLAGIGDLKVISRTSTEKYKSHPDDLKIIAQQLGVATILEGSVQKSGNQVLINVQLIDAATDDHLWADAYPRTLDNIFGVEGEVAQKVAESLHAALTHDERSALARKPTENAAAYEAYIKALALQASPTFIGTAVDEALQTAVKLDPGFALAWAELAWQHLRAYWFGFDPTATRLDKAKAALDRAVALAPDLPQVAMAQAEYLYYAQRDFAAALAVMHRVQRGLPNDSRVWFVSAAIERRLGLWDAAVADFERARDLDPGNAHIRFELVLTPLMQHRYEPALQRVDAELALDGELIELLEMKFFAEWNLGGLEAGEGVLAGLQARAQAAHAVWPPTPGINALRAAQALFRRDFKQASALFGQASAATDDVRSEFFAGAYVPGNVGYRLRQALSEQRGGSPAMAAQIYRDVQARAAAALGAKPANPNVEAAWHAVLGLADAGLGERDEAVAEAQRAVALIPESKDAFEGPYWQDYLAQVYALNGDATRALPLIEHLLQTAGSMTTPALLKLDPVWDPIRCDPRFVAVVAKLKTTDPYSAKVCAGKP